MTAAAPTQSYPPAPGDVIVAKVGDRYYIGQEHAAHDALTPIAMRSGRDDALALACRFVTRDQHVFLYQHGSSLRGVEIDRAKHR